jgi:hypothetical protein
MMSKKLQPHKFVKLLLMAAFLWGHPLQSQVSHDVLAQIARVSYALHHASTLTSWKMIPIEDEDHTYGAVFYPKAPGRMEAVIALKGTETFADWQRNIMPELTLCRMCGEKNNLYVHKGYYIRAKEILPHLNEALRSLGIDGYRFTFTGHSLGGAVVSILSLLNIAMGPKSSYQSLVTFGAPQAGDAATVLRIDGFFGNHQAHYRFFTDIVPVAFPTVDFLGALVSIDEDQLGKTYQDYTDPYWLECPSGSATKKSSIDVDSWLGLAGFVVAQTCHSMKHYEKALKLRK